MKKEGTFYIIYDWMVDIGLSSNDLNLYALIYSFTSEGKFWMASRSYLAKRIGCSVITVYKSILFLLDNGLLEKREIMNGNVPSVEYRAIKNLNPIKKINNPIKKINSLPIKEINRSPIKNLNTNNKDNNKDNNKKHISKDIRKKVKSEKEQRFDDGMKNAYPRVMHMKQPLTYDQYNKLLEKGYTPDVIRETLEAMENYKKLDTYVSSYLTLNKWLSKN